MVLHSACTPTCTTILAPASAKLRDAKWHQVGHRPAGPSETACHRPYHSPCRLSAHPGALAGMSPNISVVVTLRQAFSVPPLPNAAACDALLSTAEGFQSDSKQWAHVRDRQLARYVQSRSHRTAFCLTDSWNGVQYLLGLSLRCACAPAGHATCAANIMRRTVMYRPYCPCSMQRDRAAGAAAGGSGAANGGCAGSSSHRRRQAGRVRSAHSLQPRRLTRGPWLRCSSVVRLLGRVA